jgi:hypothetical protein
MPWCACRVDDAVGGLELLGQGLPEVLVLGVEAVGLQVAEEGADEVVGRVVVTGPAEQEGVVLERRDVVEVATVPRLGDWC